MRSVGETFPTFRLQAVVGTEPGREFREIDERAFPGKWKIVFFWPMDFTFVCPTEIAEFARLNREFADRDAVVLGGSPDNEHVKLAWRREHPDLHNLPIWNFADSGANFARALGVLNEDEGVAYRATLVVDPDNVVQHVYVNNLNVGRNPQDTLRVLDALQTDELCPCNRAVGGETLKAA